ncbi:MAG: ATP-binding protein [Pseudanabaenaceae cyanobacterium bins.68]|nr:ATP-binding protein [Pseudanabaenaceae cyanobacterium bins.68]
MNRILIVEDDLISAYALQTELENLDYRIIAIADDYESAIAAVTESFIDCAIVDINLHGKPIGIDIAKQIRQIGKCPIVFLSSYNNTQLLMQTAPAMPYGYLNKPYRLTDLHTTITTAIQKYRLEILEKQTARKQQEIYQLAIQRDATLFHDLRNSLGSIMLALSSFDDHPKSTVIKRAVDKALSIINQGQLAEDLAPPEQLCLIKYANSLIQEILIITQYKCPIALVSEFQHLQVEVCEKYLWQILNNLIHNAVKYSLPGKLIEVIIDQRGQKVILEVSDHGIGIPLESLEEIFNFNYRAANVGDIPGNGIGLYGVKQAIEALDGEIRVDSVVGQGSVFAIALPIVNYANG